MHRRRFLSETEAHHQIREHRHLAAVQSRLRQSAFSDELSAGAARQEDHHVPEPVCLQELAGASHLRVAFLSRQTVPAAVFSQRQQQQPSQQ